MLVQGKWRVAVYNPASSLFPVAYNLTAKQVGYCLHDCSNHGRCQDDGTCICDDGYAGGDCSVTSSGGSAGCTPGSRRPTHMYVILPYSPFSLVPFLLSGLLLLG